MDNVLAGAKQVCNEFATEVSKYAKPYMRQLTAQILAAGVPSEHIQYAFREVFEGQRRWRLPPKYKHALSAMNSVVSNELLVPNYNREVGVDFSSEMDMALGETAKWLLGSVSRELNQKFNKIALKTAAKSAAKDGSHSMSWYADEYRDVITHAPSTFPNGTVTAEVLYSLLR